MALWTSVEIDELGPTFRLDPEFYTSAGAQVRAALAKHGVPFSCIRLVNCASEWHKS